MKDRIVQPLSAPKVCFGVLASPLKKQGALPISFFYEEEWKLMMTRLAGGRLKVGDVVTVLDSYPKSANGVWVRDEDRVN